MLNSRPVWFPSSCRGIRKIRRAPQHLVLMDQVEFLGGRVKICCFAAH